MNEYRAACHEEFKKTLKNSEPYKWKVAEWFSSMRFYVIISPLRYSETYHTDPNDWEKYSDFGDLYVSRHLSLSWERVEVKSSTKIFRSRKDFKYDDFLIIQAKQFNVDPKPAGIIHVSADMKAFAIVRSDTYGCWTLKEIYLKIYNQHRVNYHCPFNCVRFLNFDTIPSPEQPEN